MSVPVAVVPEFLKNKPEFAKSGAAISNALLLTLVHPVGSLPPVGSVAEGEVVPIPTLPVAAKVVVYWAFDPDNTETVFAAIL